MKRALRIVAVLGLAVLLASCAGQRARENVLLPAMRLAWPEVRADVDLGVPLVANGADAEAEANELTAALAADDPITAASGVEWAPIEAAARAGIDERVRTGRLGEGGKANRIEQTTQFGARLAQLLRRAQ